MGRSYRKRHGGWSPATWRLAAVVVSAIIVGLIRYWPVDYPETVSGSVRVIDGDSIRVNGEEIRLVGIDAPESRQTCLRNKKEWKCGAAATRALRGFVSNRSVSCEVEGLDKYDRLLAVCSRGTREINAWLVSEGWAVAYGGYRSEEAKAEAGRRGIWSSKFVSPRVWRDQHLTGALAAAAS